MQRAALTIVLPLILVGVILPWSSAHPWSQAILYRKLPNVRSINCQPLRCMDGSFVATCNAYGYPLAFIQSPCRGH